MSLGAWRVTCWRVLCAVHAVDACRSRFYVGEFSVPRLHVSVGPSAVHGPFVWRLFVGVGLAERILMEGDETPHRIALDLSFILPIVSLRRKAPALAATWTGRTSEVIKWWIRNPRPRLRIVRR